MDGWTEGWMKTDQTTQFATSSLCDTLLCLSEPPFFIFKMEVINYAHLIGWLQRSDENNTDKGSLWSGRLSVNVTWWRISVIKGLSRENRYASALQSVTLHVTKTLGVDSGHFPRPFLVL